MMMPESEQIMLLRSKAEASNSNSNSSDENSKLLKSPISLGRRLSLNNNNRYRDSIDEENPPGQEEVESGLADPPEWALLLIGCLLGLATGLCVAAFNRGVHVIHEWAWAGTPNEGAAWLRLQSLSDTWHRILLIPVTGGVIVGMMHGLLEILDQIKPPSPSSSSQTHSSGFDLLPGVFPTIKAIQAAVTLGIGCSR